ncbi:MAG: AAA family ATPase [Negativicutes bacterium]|jgi:broad-specificity NMP kinase
MKKLIIINGTMGVGKTAVCSRLYKLLEHSVWLDGDWCWLMNPWDFSDENKSMVMDNISHLLRNYLANSSFQYVIFNWVMHEQVIFDELLQRLEGYSFELIKISLTCPANELVARMKSGGREERVITDSLTRLPNYQRLDTIKVDTSNKSIDAVCREILLLI